MTNPRQKEMLRKEMKELIKSYSRDDLNKFSARICERVNEFIKEKDIRRLGVFAPLSGEVNIWVLTDQSFLRKQESRKLAIYFPRIHSQNELEFVQIKSREELQPGKYGILEPIPALPSIDPGQLDAIVVPGLAFDRVGNRLGKGKGYYDTFLAKLPKKVIRVGVCFPFQMTENIPLDDWDQKLDHVISG